MFIVKNKNFSNVENLSKVHKKDIKTMFDILFKVNIKTLLTVLQVCLCITDLLLPPCMVFEYESFIDLFSEYLPNM